MLISNGIVKGWGLQFLLIDSPQKFGEVEMPIEH